MKEVISEVMKSYFNDAKALQNYIVGFSVLQSITFLYGLDKFLNKIYKFKYLICLALIVASLINITVLFIASNYEMSIVKESLLKIDDQNKEFTFSLIKEAKWFRIILVLIINAITLLVFFITASNHKEENAVKA